MKTIINMIKKKKNTQQQQQQLWGNIILENLSKFENAINGNNI